MLIWMIWFSDGYKWRGMESRPLSLNRAAAEHLRVVAARLRWPIPALFLTFLGLVAQGTTLVGRRVFDFAVDGAAFVVFG